MQFENGVKQAELKLRTSVTKLLLLMGRPANADGIDITGDLRSERPVFVAEQVKEEAYQKRPDLLALSRDRVRSQSDIRLQIAEGKVDYSVGVLYHHQYGYSSSSSMGFFFQTQLPVWNRNQGEIERAKREEVQVQARVKALEAQIENEVRVSYDQFLTSRELVDRIEKQLLGNAKEVRDITEYSYRRGEASFVEFLDAQRAYNDAVQSYNDARADYARSLYSLESVAGRGVNP